MSKKKVCMARPALRSGAAALASSTFVRVSHGPLKEREWALQSPTDIILQCRDLEECVCHLKDTTSWVH